MAKKGIYIFWVALSVVAWASVCWSDDASSERVASLLGGRVRLSDNGGDFSEDVGKYSRKVRRDRIRKSHAPEDLFLKMRDQKLTWGCMNDYADLMLKISPLSLPPQATVEQVEQIVASAKLKLIEMAGNQFVQNWAIVPKARAAGIDVTEGEIQRALTNSVRRLYKKNKSVVLPEITRSDSFFYRNQVGYLISKKYFDTVVSRSVSVTDEDMAQAMTNRLAEIDAARDHNVGLRPKMERLLAEIKSGSRNFEEAAYEYSECDSSSDEGCLGEFERDNNKLLPELRAFIFAASTNELSEVIETPYSYHLVKILKREYGASGDLDAERETEGGAVE